MSGTTRPSREGSRGTAVVSGAAQGLGQAFAEALAAGGHDVAIIDLQPAEATRELVEGHGRAATCFVGDASDADAVADFVRQVRAEMAPVRVLVNNAGISPYAPFAETDLQTWHRVIRINLDSLFQLTQQFLPDLIASGAGRIVNLASSVVWDFQAKDMTAYATTKAAVVGFTRALAGEVGVHEVTVNAIAPGIALTPDIADRVALERLDAYRDRQAIKRIATPADLVSALDFLVDERSGHVTGTILPVNGGRVVV